MLTVAVNIVTHMSITNTPGSTHHPNERLAAIAGQPRAPTKPDDANPGASRCRPRVNLYELPCDILQDATRSNYHIALIKYHIAIHHF